MYRQLVPLHPQRHAGLRLRPLQHYGFAAGTLTAPFVLDEIADVARDYPFVFPTQNGLPMVLLGVEADSNAYVHATGRWMASYLPAYIRHYPFALRPAPHIGAPQDNPPEKTKMTLYVDVAASVLGKEEGEPIFQEDGELSPAMRDRVRHMEQDLQRIPATRAMVAAIEAAGILIERKIIIKNASGEENVVATFRVINEVALNRLDEIAFRTLRRAGALPLVYAQLLSWAHLRNGPIGRSHPLPSPKPLVGLMFNMDDSISFPAAL